MVQRNLENWVALFDEKHKERLPVLKVYLTFENQRVKFFPSYEDLEDLIVSVANDIMNQLQKVSSDLLTLRSDLSLFTVSLLTTYDDTQS